MKGLFESRTRFVAAPRWLRLQATVYAVERAERKCVNVPLCKLRCDLLHSYWHVQVIASVAVLLTSRASRDHSRPRISSRQLVNWSRHFRTSFQWSISNDIRRITATHSDWCGSGGDGSSSSRRRRRRNADAEKVDEVDFASNSNDPIESRSTKFVYPKPCGACVGPLQSLTSKHYIHRVVYNI